MSKKLLEQKLREAGLSEYLAEHRFHPVRKQKIIYGGKI